ncbi:MAG: NADH-quinone oxidoreductase subunit C [Firmicutes bacterium]|nr:NADH-quinone oxidoreductase subunit C [Bacillota bacterium]
MDNLAPDKSLEKLNIYLQQPLEISSDPYFTYLSIHPADLLPLFGALQEQLGMNYLANLTAADLGAEFEIIYHLYAIPDNGLKLAVKTQVPRSQAELASLYALYPTADWQEREIFDLMGIRFIGHPNLVRVLLPDDFDGHPLRKDYKKGAE